MSVWDDDDDLSLFFIVTPFIVLGAMLIGVLLSTQEESKQQWNCPELRIEAIKLVQEHPEVAKIPFTNSQQTECHLNEVIEEALKEK